MTPKPPSSTNRQLPLQRWSSAPHRPPNRLPTDPVRSSCIWHHHLVLDLLELDNRVERREIAARKHGKVHRGRMSGVQSEVHAQGLRGRCGVGGENGVTSMLDLKGIDTLVE